MILNPEVSVILPVYNAENYLHESISSILGQKFENFELVIFDDGSNDNSLNIIKGFADSDYRIRVLSAQNRGLVYVLNDLVDNARAPLIARMDADDISDPRRLEIQKKFLDENLEFIAVGSSVEWIDYDGAPLGVISPPTKHEKIDELHLVGCTSMLHPSVMIRTDALRAIDGYNTEFRNSEDLDMWLRLAEIGKIANQSEVLLKYRITATSISGSKREEQRAYIEKACKRAWTRRGLPEQPIKYREWRPGADRRSRHEFAIKYGWMAWNHRNRRTFWRYALRALSIRPFSMESWRLFCVGVIRPSGPKFDA